FTRRIVAEQHDRKPRHNAVRGRQKLRLGFDGYTQISSDRLAVDDLGAHAMAFNSRPSNASSICASPAIRSRLRRAAEPASSSIPSATRIHGLEDGLEHGFDDGLFNMALKP